MLQFTELALTLGNWGRAPMPLSTRRALLDELLFFTGEGKISCQVETYFQLPDDRAVLEQLLRVEQDGLNLSARPRCQPHSGLFRTLHEIGSRTVVFDVPVSAPLAHQRFLPDGVGRVADFADRHAESAALSGLEPELALLDIIRAEEETVLQVVDRVRRTLRVRGMEPRFRLIDMLGTASPFAGQRRPRSLAAWQRLLTEKAGVDPVRITVQASNQLGLGLANTVSGIGGLRGFSSGTGFAGSLFGMGHGGGWAPTEQALLHLLPGFHWHGLETTRILLHPESWWGEHHPVSGSSAWEIPSDTSPEDLGAKVPVFLPDSPGDRFASLPNPLLTPLSGKAGLLHLMHRHNPEQKYDTDDTRVEEIYEEFNRQFRQGRNLPISWAEIRPVAKAHGLMGELEK